MTIDECWEVSCESYPLLKKSRQHRNKEYQISDATATVLEPHCVNEHNHIIMLISTMW